MEVLALNERLRDAFSPVLRHVARLPPPAKDQAPDAFRAHAATVLRRVNALQYGAAAAFVRDLRQLQPLAPPDAARLIQNIVDGLELGAKQEAASEQQKGTKTPDATHGLRFAGSGVPGLQPMRRDAGDDRERWRVNANVQDAVLTMGEGDSLEDARALYEARRAALAASPQGLESLLKLSQQVRDDRRMSDEQVLREAVALCHPRLATSTAVRVSDLAAPARPMIAIPAPMSTTAAAATPAIKDERPAVSSPTSSVASSMSSRTGSRYVKRKKPAHRLAFLRLRRLIQKKLCVHLRGQSVCVFSRPDTALREPDSAWVPTGRLENGRIFSFKQRKQLTFAEFVMDAIGRMASACPHIFLVETRESIDEHLKVCDAFSEDDRMQLGYDLYGSVRNYMQSKEERR